MTSQTLDSLQIEHSSREEVVSIVIATFNSRGTIERCIESIRVQHCPHIEIIVVDDGSTDDTTAIAEQTGARVLRLQKNFGVSYALNRGIELASGRYVFTLDSDAELIPAVMGKAIAALRSGSCEVVGGTYIAPFVDRGLSRLIELYRKAIHVIPHSEIFMGATNPQVSGTFLGFKAEIFQVEKFDESLRAIQDREFLCRLARKGFRILYSPELVVYHRVPSSLFGFVRRTWTLAVWTNIAGMRYPVIIKRRLVLAAGVAATLALTLHGLPAVLPLAILAYYLRFVISCLAKKGLGMPLRDALSVAALAIFVSIIELASLVGSVFTRPTNW